MADVAAMDLVIGAQVTGATTGLQAVQKELIETATAAAGLDSTLDLASSSMTNIGGIAIKTAKSFDEVSSEVFAAGDAFNAKWNPVIKQAADEAAKATVQVRTLADAVARFGGGVKTFTSAAGPKLGDSLKQIAPGSNTASQALINLGRVVQDAPYGFMGIANNLNPLLESFQRASKDAGGFGGALKSMGKDLMGAGGIGLALSVATSLIVVFGDSISFTSKEAAAAAKRQKEYNEAMAASIAPAQTQITVLNDLLSIARDSTQSMETQKNAINEITRLHPELAKAIKDTGINSETTKAQIDKLTESLILQAKAAAINNLLTKAYEEQAKAQNSQILDNISGWGIFGQVMKSTGNAGAIAGNVVGKAMENQSTAVTDATKNISIYEEQLKTLQQQLAQGGLFKTGGKTADTKHVKDASDVLKELTESLTGLNRVQQELGGDLRLDMIKAIDSAMEALVKMGVAASDPRIKALQETLKKIKQTIIEPGQIADLFPKVDIKIKPLPHKDIVEQLTGGVIPELPFAPTLSKEELDKLANEVKASDMMKSISEGLQSAVADGLSSFGEGLGKLLSGDKNPFAGLVDSLGQAMEAIGKTMIKYGVALLVMQKVLKAGIFANPFVAIAAGVALTALAGVLKSSMPHMAEGGIVTGPTRALIGERGPEVVLPLDRLREFMQPSTSQVVVLETRVRGQDLWLSQSRTNERRNRTY